MAVYLRHPTRRDFSADILAHLRTGYVVATPWGFVAFRPVLRDSPEDLILDPQYEFPYADTWHVWLAAGDWKRLLLEHLPFGLPWISWERDFKLRFWRLEKLLAKAEGVSLAGGYGQRRIKGGHR
jgi:hypothetical protein